MNTSINKTENQRIEKLPWTELVKRIGPGMILTGIVIGPGAITTGAMMGADYGYSLMWIFVPILLMGSTFLMTTYRITTLTGKPILEAIEHYYGSFFSKLVGISFFIACTFFTIGNVSGSGMGMNLLFGMNWRIGAIIVIALSILIYFSKDVYTKVEKLITFLVFGMIVAFLITLIGTGGPKWSTLGTSLYTWKFPEGSTPTALAFISTNASIMTGIYGTYLGKEKKWSKDDLLNGVMTIDSLSHMLSVILISGAIVLVGVIVLHPTGTSITSPSQLGELLEPSLGRFAPIVMGAALTGAGFSSLLANTQRSLVFLNAGFNKPTNLDHKSIKYGSVIVILVSMIIAFVYGSSPTQLILIANLFTSIAMPVGGFFLCLMIGRKDINKELGIPRLLQISMYISYIFTLFLTIPTLFRTIRTLLNL